MEAQPADALRELGLVRAEQAALAGGDVLDRVQREDRCSAARRSACRGNACRWRGRHPRSAGCPARRPAAKGSRSSGAPGVVDGDDQPGALRDQRLDASRASPSACRGPRRRTLASAPASVIEVDGRHPRHRGRDHLVARGRSRSACNARCMPAVAEVSGDRGGRPERRGRLLLEPRQRGPVVIQPGSQHVRDGRDLGVAERRAREGEEVLGAHVRSRRERGRRRGLRPRRRPGAPLPLQPG